MVIESQLRLAYVGGLKPQPQVVVLPSSTATCLPKIERLLV